MWKKDTPTDPGLYLVYEKGRKPYVVDAHPGKCGLYVHGRNWGMPIEDLTGGKGWNAAWWFKIELPPGEDKK